MEGREQKTDAAACLLFLFGPQLPLREVLVAQIVKNPAMQEAQVQPLGREDPQEKGMATHSSILV